MGGSLQSERGKSADRDDSARTAWIRAGARAVRHARWCRRRAAASGGTGRARVVIIGAGPGGLCAAVQLARAGYTDVKILEAQSSAGGVWHANTYPGAACDIPSHLYSFSFASKRDWSRRFAGQEEIVEYYRQLSEDPAVAGRIRFDARVEALRWQDEQMVWQVELQGGETLDADVVVAACGQLSAPHVPDIAGAATFQGSMFHSAQWNHEVEVVGRRVAVIGNGASAVQFVPPLAHQAESLTVFQRSANWILPKPDAEFSRWFKVALARVPGVQRLYRWSIYLRLESRVTLMRDGSRLGRLVERVLRRQLEGLVSDKLPRRALIPDYPVGCKRILLSNDYYATLRRDNVAVVTDPLIRIDETGVVVDDKGREVHRPVDLIVWGTGFRSTSFLGPIEVVGTAGRRLSDEWSDGARARHGISVHGFPNLFLLYGPNTNLGHNSILFMIEAQVRHIRAVLDENIALGRRAAMVGHDAYSDDDRDTQRRAASTVWTAGCDNWYRNDAGRLTNNLPGSTLRYWWTTHGVVPGDYVAVVPGDEVAVAPGDAVAVAPGTPSAAT